MYRYVKTQRFFMLQLSVCFDTILYFCPVTTLCARSDQEHMMVWIIIPVLVGDHRQRIIQVSLKTSSVVTRAVSQRVCGPTFHSGNQEVLLVRPPP